MRNYRDTIPLIKYDYVLKERSICFYKICLDVLDVISKDLFNNKSCKRATISVVRMIVLTKNITI